MLPVFVGKFIDVFSDFISFVLFRYEINKCDNIEEVVIFDLDNTLLNTYPLLHSMSLKNVFKNVEVHAPMIKLFNRFNKKGVYLFILSSRKIRYYGITKQYLRRNIKTTVPFYLVSDPRKKIKFIKYCTGHISTVTFFDDMSYNHENGEVKYFNDIIKEIRQLPILYFGYEDIKKINSSFDDEY